MRPTLEEVRPNEAVVNNSFVKAILSNSTLKDLVYKRGNSRFTLFLADFVNDPRHNGGSEYDVDFRQDFEDADVWHVNYSVSTSRKILQVLSSVTGAHFASDLHDLMRLACGCDEDDGMRARFEEGVDADPTENMSPEDKKKWWDAHAEHKDNFKGAGFSYEMDSAWFAFVGNAPFNKDTIDAIRRINDIPFKDDEGTLHDEGGVALKVVRNEYSGPLTYADEKAGRVRENVVQIEFAKGMDKKKILQALQDVGKKFKLKVEPMSGYKKPETRGKKADEMPVVGFDVSADLDDMLDALSITAGDKTAAPRYRDYVRRFKGPGSPMKQDEWEAKVLGKKPSKPEGKKDDSKKDAPKEKSYKKRYHKTVETVMDKHELTDTDASEVKAFKSDKPASGVKLSPAELLKKFLAKAKPETKERMKGVSPAEFIKMLGAIMDDAEGVGKAASIDSMLSVMAMEFDSPEALKKYLHDHPNADKSQHHVKQDSGGKEGPAHKHPIPKNYYDMLGDRAKNIRQSIEDGKPINRLDAKKVKENLDSVFKKEKEGTASIDPTVRRHYKSMLKFVNEVLTSQEGKSASDMLMAMDFQTQDALKKYLHDHPDADRSKHHVKQDSGGGESKSEKPEAKKDDGTRHTERHETGKNMVHDAYKDAPAVVREVMESITDQSFDKNKSYSAKPIKDAIKILKTKVTPEEARKLLEGSEKAKQNADKAISKAYDVGGSWDSPEYKGAEQAYNKAQNTWRVFRQLVEEAKTKPWKMKGQGKSASELLDVLARFEEGVSVDVEQYLRDHGNPEAAEAWADMNEEYGDLLKKANGEWVISPGALIARALAFDLLTLDQAQSHTIREAARSVAEDLRTSMGADEGFGTSDATHAVKTMMEYAGFTMGWPNGRLGILAQPKRLAAKEENLPVGEGSEVPDGEGNEQKRARTTWASPMGEETVELWALASSDGYMFAATDKRSDAMSPSHWRQAGVDDTQLEEDAVLLHLAKVPLDLAEKLKDAGTRASSYDDGYEAMRAARPFLQGAGRRLAADEMESSWGGVIAKEASEGLYGFPKGIQAACEAASKRIGKAALSKAKEIYAKDEKVAEFLQAHAKKAKSLPAKVLLAAMKEIGPKIPDEPEDEGEESSEKEAALSDIRAKRAAMYGLYGFTEKVASLGLNACTSVRHEAGKIASELHRRKADHHERISSFLKEHCKTAKCVNSKMLLASYPDATVRLASGAEWLSWDEK